jgi:hypothetical protein
MMKALGCLAHLAVVAALTVVIDRATGAQVAPVLRPWAGLLASVLLVLGASNFLQLLRGYGQGDASRSALLARATTGEPPAEGGPMLVTGTVRADGPSMRAPLSGTECVAYQYRLYKRVWLGTNRGHSTTVYWGGYAFQPFMVDTGARAVRVGAMPDFVDEPSRDKTDATIQRAREYVQATPFEEIAGVEILSLFGTMLGDRVGEFRAGVRRDWHRADTNPDPGTLKFEEHVLPTGATVSVAGYWLPERSALVPEPGGLGGSPVTVVTGGPRGLLRRNTALPSSAISVAVFGVLLLVLGAALVWAASQGYLAG